MPLAPIRGERTRSGVAPGPCGPGLGVECARHGLEGSLRAAATRFGDVPLE